MKVTGIFLVTSNEFIMKHSKFLKRLMTIFCFKYFHFCYKDDFSLVTHFASGYVKQ